MIANYKILYISTFIVSWTIAYFIVIKKNKQVLLFEKNLGFCLLTSMFLYLTTVWIAISYIYEPETPSFIDIILDMPIYVSPIWSFILVIYSIQLKARTIVNDVLDD